MNRRRFLKSTAAAASLPSVGKIDLTESEEERSMKSYWFYSNDRGRCLIYADEEVDYNFSLDIYDIWRRSTLINTAFVNEALEFPVDFSDYNLVRLDIDQSQYDTTFINRGEEMIITFNGDYTEHHVTILEDYKAESDTVKIYLKDGDLERLIGRIYDKIEERKELEE